MAWSDAARRAAAEARRLKGKGLRSGTAKQLALASVAKWGLTGSMRGDRADWIKKVRGAVGAKKARALVRAADLAEIAARKKR